MLARVGGELSSSLAWKAKGKRWRFHPLSNHKSSEESSFEFGVICTEEKLHLISRGQHCWGYAFCVYLVKTTELVTDSSKESLFTQIETVEYSCWSCLTNITNNKRTATREYGRYPRVRIWVELLNHSYLHPRWESQLWNAGVSIWPVSYFPSQALL